MHATQLAQIGLVETSRDQAVGVEAVDPFHARARWRLSRKMIKREDGNAALTVGPAPSYR